MMKNNAMDYLPRMVIFSRVVELGAFSKAARELGLTSSSVSQHISALEAILGTTLLHRTTRKLSLTEEEVSPSSRAALEKAPSSTTREKITMRGR